MRLLTFLFVCVLSSVLMADEVQPANEVEVQSVVGSTVTTSGKLQVTAIVTLTKESTSSKVQLYAREGFSGGLIEVHGSALGEVAEVIIAVAEKKATEKIVGGLKIGYSEKLKAVALARDEEFSMRGSIYVEIDSVESLANLLRKADMVNQWIIARSNNLRPSR